MYCRNCGAPLQANAAACLNCGAAVGDGRSFCPHCGATIAYQNAAICVKCGGSLTGSVSRGVGGRSRVVAFLLALFLGCFGVHNFYLGYNGKAFLQLALTLLLFWTILVPLGVSIWALVEGIHALQGKLTDADGQPLQE